MVRLNVSAKGESKRVKSTRLLKIEFKASKEILSAKIQQQQQNPKNNNKKLKG